MGPVLRMRTPRSSRPCQTASRSPKTPNRTKLASLSATVRPRPRSQPTRSSRSRRSALDGRERLVPVCERGAGDGLGDRGQVIRQPHQEQRVHHGRVGGQVAEPGARGGEGLGHRAGHHEPRPAGQQGERARGARAGELGVRLVDDDQAGGRVVHLLDERERHGGARRVVRRGDEHDVRLVLSHLLGGGGQAVARVAAALGPPGAGDLGDQRVHRVGRLEAERGAARAAERLEQLLYDLVGAVRGPHLPRGKAVAEVVGEVLAQVDGVAVRVAVERARDAGDRVRDRLPQALARRVRVLVGVQLDGDVELRGAVGVQVPQVGAGAGRGSRRRAVTGAPPPPRARGLRTAATWAARSSAPPSASTRGATAASESRSHSMTLTTLRYG